MILNGWKEKKVLSVFNLINGFSFSSNDARETGIKWLKITNVGIGGLTWETCSFLPIQFLEDYKEYIVSKGDIVVAMTRPLLNMKLKIVKLTNNSDLALLNQRVGKLNCKQGVEQEFIFQLLTSSSFAQKLNLSLSGTDPPNISVNTLNNIIILLPPLPEQKAIANILQTWDTAIEKTEALIAAKEKQFEWFRSNILTGHVRIKGYSNPWKYQLFKSILHEHKETSTGSELVHSVSVHKGVINQIEHLGRSFAAASTENYNLVKSGDIIYTKSPTGNFPYGIIKQSKLPENVIVSPLYGVFTPHTYALGTILDAYFESKTLTRNYLYPIIQKGAKNTINCTNTTFISKGLMLPTNSKEEIELAKYIDTTKKEIILLKQQAELYRTQKRGLMQKLLTGEWRVKV